MEWIGGFDVIVGDYLDRFGGHVMLKNWEIEGHVGLAW